MSYRVNPKSLTFDDLTETEALQLREQVDKLVLAGAGVFDTEGFQAWCKAIGYDERQQLLVMATAYPQRVYLSLLRHEEKQIRSTPMGVKKIVIRQVDVGFKVAKLVYRAYEVLSTGELYDLHLGEFEKADLLVRLGESFSHFQVVNE